MDNLSLDDLNSQANLSDHSGTLEGYIFGIKKAELMIGDVEGIVQPSDEQKRSPLFAQRAEEIEGILKRHYGDCDIAGIQTYCEGVSVQGRKVYYIGRIEIKKIDDDSNQVRIGKLDLAASTIRFSARNELLLFSFAGKLPLGDYHSQTEGVLKELLPYLVESARNELTAFAKGYGLNLDVSENSR